MSKENPTRDEFNTLCSSVKNISELVKKGQGDNKDLITNLVKQVLADHPGRTAPTKIEFSGTKVLEGSVQRIVRKMPVELQIESDNIFIMSKMLGVHASKLKSYQAFRDGAKEYIKALDTAESGGGNEWVPTDFSPELEKLITLELQVAALFPEIPMPTNPYTLPIQVGRIKTFKQPEQTGDTSQTKIPVGDGSSITDNTTFTAIGHAARVITSKDLEEDSIIPILPFLREDMAVAIAEGREDGVLNGDTAGTHEDADAETEGATGRKKMWLGLRATANDQSYKTDLSSMNITALRTFRASMGKYGVLPKNLAWITGPISYSKLLGISEVITVDKYGPAATILSGELAKLDGIPVVVSGLIKENLNASGIQDGVTTDRTVLHLVHRRGHAFGNRRGFTVQLLKELLAESDQDILLTRERRAWRDLFPIASNQTTRLGYNISA